MCAAKSTEQTSPGIGHTYSKCPGYQSAKGTPKGQEEGQKQYVHRMSSKCLKDFC